MPTTLRGKPLPGLREATVETSTGKISIYDEGQGVPVVFLHGWSANRKFWAYVIDEVKSQFRCVAMDFPGHGTSEAPKCAVSFRTYEKSIGETVDSLNLQKFHLVCHSMSGMVGTMYAAANSGRLLSLTLVNSPIYGKKALFMRARVMTMQPFRRLSHMIYKIPAIRYKISSDFRVIATANETIAREVMNVRYRVLSPLLDDIHDTDIRDMLRKIRVPITAFVCLKDDLVKPDQRFFLKEIPNVRLIEIPENQHIPMLETPADFSRRLLEVLSTAGRD